MGGVELRKVCMIFGDVCVQTSPVHHRGMVREYKVYLVPSVPNKGSMSWAASGATASLRTATTYQLCNDACKDETILCISMN